MSDEKAVVVREAKPAIVIGERGVEIKSIEEAIRFATCVAQSGLAPKGFEKVEAIVIAVQMGAEIGLSPMAALQNVAVINGKPGIYGDAALAVVRGSGLCESYSQDVAGEGDAKMATVITKRKGAAEPIVSTFSVADAKRAALWGKAGPWTQYPQRMLMWRARGFNLRDNFGDVLKGMKTVEELQDTSMDITDEVTVGKSPMDVINAATPASETLRDKIAKKGNKSEEGKHDTPTVNPIVTEAVALVERAKATKVTKAMAAAGITEYEDGAEWQGAAIEKITELVRLLKL